MAGNSKKICFVAPFAYPILANKNYGSCGGAEVQQVLIAKALRDMGFSIAFVVNDYGQNALEVHDGIEVVSCPFRYLGGNNVHFPIDTIRLIYTLKKIKADVCLLKTPCSLLFTMAIHRRLFGGKLIKLIAHDSECTEQPKGLVSRLYTMGITCLDFTVFQTQRQQEVGGRMLGLRGTVIKNIAHQEAPVDGSPPADKDIDVLWVGTCNRHKRPELFLDLAQDMPDTSFKMIIAPGLDADFNSKIAARAQKLRNLEYLGFVKYQLINQYYSRAKILVHTSQNEGFPNVFLQAWQFSTPVVSLEIDPDGVIVRNGIGSVSGDISSMRKDVHCLLANESLRNEVGHRAKRYLLENHSADIIVQRYADIFES